MRNPPIPKLLTPGRLADELGVPLPRVLYVLATRRHISPEARAGTLRLYSRKAVAMVRHELDAIAARKTGKPHLSSKPDSNPISERGIST